MTEMHVLLLHGLGGSGPWHWQHWLATQLREQGVQVDLPAFPEPHRPELDSWLAVLRARLDAVPASAELVVAAHSWGAALWLQHAATVREDARRADRVLLVSPPDPDRAPSPELHQFLPLPVDARALRRAAGVTRLVVGTGDPEVCVFRAHRLADALHAELDVIPDGEHLTTESGYGPWPSLLKWALYASVPLLDRFEGESASAGWSPDRLRLV